MNAYLTFGYLLFSFSCTKFLNFDFVKYCVRNEYCVIGSSWINVQLTIFCKITCFLTFTILIVPGLLASLIIIPINMLTLNISTITISKISYFIIAGLCFFILTFFISFLLREDPKNMGMHDEIVLKKIKTISQWKIIILIMFGLTIYLIYYLMNSQFFNYKISSIDQRWHVYKILFTTLPQVIGVFYWDDDCIIFSVLIFLYILVLEFI